MPPRYIGGVFDISHKIMAGKPYFRIFYFFSGMALQIMPEDCLNLGHYNLFKLWWNSAYRHFGKTLNMVKFKLFVSVYKTFFQTTQQNPKILHTNSPWVCVIKVCSNSGATYIIGEPIATYSLINIANLMQNNFLLQNSWTEYLDITHK